jgi:hypothetical protein
MIYMIIHANLISASTAPYMAGACTAQFRKKTFLKAGAEITIFIRQHLDI